MIDGAVHDATGPRRHCSSNESHPSMETYIVSVKRNQRAAAPTNLADAIEPIEGVEIISASTPSQVQIEASDEGVKQVRESLGGCCHIESIIPHHTSTVVIDQD
jgi:hypothetical protein